MADYERDSGWISGSVVDAEDARLATGVLAAAAADPGNPIASRTGLKPAPGSPGNVLATSTPSRNVTVNPFQAVIQGTRTTAAGPYLATLAQRKTLDVLGAAPADPSNPRIALVIAEQTDRQYGDTSDGMLVRVVAGAPAVSPVRPTVTGDHLPLAEIKIPANAGVITQDTITDLRVSTVAAGGVLPLAAYESLPADGYDGQRLYDRETKLDLVRRDNSWRPAVTGAVEFFGQADTGWPKTGTAGATAFTFNQVTVTPAAYPRMLVFNAQVVVNTSGTDERYDLVVRGAADGVTDALSTFHGGPTKLITAVTTGHRVMPAGTTPLVLQQILGRGGGNTTGTANVWSTLNYYTGLRIVAFPIA
jgi:hypothetical protein